MSRLYYAGKYHRDVYYAGKYHKAMYIGPNLVWEKNYFDRQTTDLYAYIHYASHAFRNAVDKTNLLTCVNIKPGKTYRVRLMMNIRFRLATVQSIPTSGTVLTNYIFHPLDTNGTSAVNTMETLEITSQPNDAILLIGYWTSIGSMAAADIRNTITVSEIS
jgi:hypothetical protein